MTIDSVSMSKLQSRSASVNANLGIADKASGLFRRSTASLSSVTSPGLRLDNLEKLPVGCIGAIVF